MTEDDRIQQFLRTTWQPPQAPPRAVATLLARVAATPQAPAPARSGTRPVLWLAAAASFALMLVWSRWNPIVPAPSRPVVSRDLLDQEALTLVFSDETLEDL